MADPSAIVSSLNLYRPDLEQALGAQAAPFFAQVEQLYGQVLAGTADQATQDQIGDQLLALVRQQPAADTLLRSVDPQTFAQPDTPLRTVTEPEPVAVQSAGPPLPDDTGTVITPVATSGTGPDASAAPADTPLAATPPPDGGSPTTTLPGGDGASDAAIPPAWTPPVTSAAPPDAAPAGSNGTDSPAAWVPAASAPDRAVAAPPLTAGAALFNKFLELLGGGIAGLIKEVIAALIGLSLIVGTVLIALVAALAALTNRAADFQAAKDVLLVMTGLTGVVLGYYFGRIPADARADQAQQQANHATQQAADATAVGRDVGADAEALAGQTRQLAATMQTRSSVRSLDPTQRQMEQQLADLERAAQALSAKARRLR